MILILGFNTLHSTKIKNPFASKVTYTGQTREVRIHYESLIVTQGVVTTQLDETIRSAVTRKKEDVPKNLRGYVQGKGIYGMLPSSTEH